MSGGVHLAAAALVFCPRPPSRVLFCRRNAAAEPSVKFTSIECQSATDHTIDAMVLYQVVQTATLKDAPLLVMPHGGYVAVVCFATNSVFSLLR